MLRVDLLYYLIDWRFPLSKAGIKACSPILRIGYMAGYVWYF